MVSPITSDFDESLKQLDQIKAVIDSVKERVDSDIVSMAEAFKILVEHHLTVHKDCTLLEDFS